MIFVEGAPRSGTSLLAVLLSAHPRIAGSKAESHLFDSGLGCLFDNHEGSGPRERFLSDFVSREELVAIARRAGDDVLAAMRERVRPGAEWVLEKTPTVRDSPEVPLSRKLECYPDAWYVHIVRDREAVVRSLMRAPWNRDPSRAGCEAWWQRGVEAIRGVLGAEPRYRELEYESLVADPVGSVCELFAWLGLEADRELRDRLAALATERVADFGPTEDEGGEVDGGAQPGRERAGRGARPARSLLAAPLRLVRRTRRRRSGPGRERAVAEAFSQAWRAADAAALEALLMPSFELVLRAPSGDVQARGPEARERLVELGRGIFDASFLTESWTTAGGSPFTVVLFSGVRPAGTRTDLAVALLVARGRVRRALVLSPGL